MDNPPRETLKDSSEFVRTGSEQKNVSRIYYSTYQLSHKKKEWDIAVLLIRLSLSLDALLGGSRDETRRWLNSKNHVFADQKPIDLIITTEGLVCTKGIAISPANVACFQGRQGCQDLALLRRYHAGSPSSEQGTKSKNYKIPDIYCKHLIGYTKLLRKM